MSQIPTKEELWGKANDLHAKYPGIVKIIRTNLEMFLGRPSTSEELMDAMVEWETDKELPDEPDPD